ncbi:transglutaminase-like cysteine peptidase [Thalassospira aquimaris]|uniref:Transglutaminase-like cysteine peptidase n=1 Tax=Thalassospira aquimaris TaxID=3037796 RepID=A0ABT6GHL8_9PROT|nr:transglutaminase-like cysteine peptidase [Thalassospira sp. FZY0004]MDG4721580.1 transglutaminase-like cysteine peptidase [Thalassospira sp. FZY0004]
MARPVITIFVRSIPTMLSVSEIDRLVRGCFVYVPDLEEYDVREDWRSHEGAVRAGEVFRGDCDDFALTVAVIAKQEGYAPDDIRLAYVVTETGGGHLVCLIGDQMIDNRMRGPVPDTFPRYQWGSSMSLARPGIWQEVI